MEGHTGFSRPKRKPASRVQMITVDLTMVYLQAAAQL
jgi:hypothetical protein